MNQKAYKALEYYKIINMLTDKASSSMGKEICRKLEPSTDIDEIRHMQTQTRDALTRLFQKGNISFGSVKDVRGSLKRLEIGSSLGIGELLAICSLLENTNRVKAYSRSERGDSLPDSLDGMFEALEPLTPLTTEIRRCILSEDEISDDASSNLRQIRRNMKITGDRIHTQLSSLVNGSARNYLQDSVITMRNGRYCIPVKAEYKGQVPGMVHDQSSTGSTLFIEPMAIVKLNNEIRELELEEQKEIEVILSTLSQQTAEQTDSIRADLNIMVQLDVIFARASLAMDMNATEPIFNDEGRIRLKQARHPLIDKKKAVPIDIRLGDDFDLLVITGPNTGGKTVSLKTVGLLTLMGQSGLHIPTLDRSELALFEEVYADIGDEQSIEQSLSTFSSHMTNVVSFLKKANRHSLVLFDELGAGTDPTEGAALAIAILSHLHEQGIRTMATTHYSELKVYALSTSGVENACCEFDVETLRPTYRLLIGIPGKSNAFAISKRLGLQEYILSAAKEFISRDEARFEDVITDLEISKKSVKFEQERAEEYRREAEELKKEVERQKEKTREQKEKILAKAREDAKQLYVQAKEEADRIIKEMNKQAKAENNRTKALEQRQKLNEKLSSMQQDFLKSKKVKPNHKAPENLKPGDRVYVISFDQNGEVLTAPDKNKEVMVQMGIMKMKVPMAELMLDDTPRPKEKQKRQQPTKAKFSKSQFISAEIDCRGQLVDEAIANIDKYIDDAYLSGLKQVVIIHGKGTGALRAGVQNYLKMNSHVKSYRPGTFGEGEAGVTVVELK